VLFAVQAVFVTFPGFANVCGKKINRNVKCVVVIKIKG